MITLTCSGKKENMTVSTNVTHLSIHHQRLKYGSTITTNHSAVFCPTSYMINATQMSAGFSTCVQQRSRYQNVIHFRYDKMVAPVSWTCLSTLNTNVLFTCIIVWVCSRAMTHLLAPAYVQRTKQERDINPNKNVSKVVRTTGEILGSHDSRVRLMGHDAL